MQETRYEGHIEKAPYYGPSKEELLRRMDEALRPGEELISRREIDEAEGVELFEKCVMRELLAIPPHVLDRPVFTKLRRVLNGYRNLRRDMLLNR